MLPIRGCAAGQGIVFDHSVLKKVYNLARVCPKRGYIISCDTVNTVLPARLI